MKRILLVDDSKLQRTANMRILTKAGYNVAVAGDGEEALALISNDPPDVVLLDLLLPKMSGVEVLRTLKQSVQTAAIPVIVLSGLSERNGAKLLKEGASAYFEKARIEGTQYAEELSRMVSSVLSQATARG